MFASVCVGRSDWHMESERERAMSTELSAGMSFVAIAIVILGRIFSFPYLALAILRRMDYLAEINVRPELSE